MIILVNGGTTTVYRMGPNPHLGILFSPQSGNSIERATDAGFQIACDNGCYTGFDELAYKAMCERMRKHVRNRLRWVTCPDVVGDAPATLDLFDRWGMWLRRRGLPIAYVAQDGCSSKQVPWSDIACLFIGGSTEWKLSDDVTRLLLIARMKCIWSHVGRVNTLKRILWCHRQHVTSIDGTSMSRFPDTYIPKFVKYVTALNEQQRMTYG